MKRVRRPSDRSAFAELLNVITGDDSFSLADDTPGIDPLARLSTIFASHRADQMLLHGKRVEAMFAYVAAALGRCLLVKEEDAGEVYARSEGPQPPDYRLILEDGTELLVEVKNCHKQHGAWTFPLHHFNQLRMYADLCQRPLFIAIYRSLWNRWSLVRADRVLVKGKTVTMDLEDGFIANEMSILGDFHLATKPPLTWRVLTTSAPIVSFQEHVTFTVQGSEFYCSGAKIEDVFEQQLAFFLMRFGGWPERNEVEIADGQARWIDFIAEPIEATPGQGFEVIGPMSSLISNAYNELTAKDGAVARLRPLLDPGALRFDIPDDYVGKRLPLWRFIQQPATHPLEGRPVET